MPDYTVNIDLPAHKRGDRYPLIGDIAIGIGPVIIDDNQPDTALDRIRMQFRNGSKVFRLDSDSEALRDAPIVIDDDATWEAHIPAIESFLPAPGAWRWDMEFYPADSAPLTLYSGILTVHKDITT